MFNKTFKLKEGMFQAKKPQGDIVIIVTKVILDLIF